MPRVAKRRTQAPSIRLDVLLYPEGGQWTAHGLQLDLVECADSASAAEKTLIEVIGQHIAWAIEDVENLFHPAPCVAPTVGAAPALTEPPNEPPSRSWGPGVIHAVGFKLSRRRRFCVAALVLLWASHLRHGGPHGKDPRTREERFELGPLGGGR
jgi:hypothetical protein